MSPVRYELVFYIPEDDILHSHRRGNLRPYIDPTMFSPSIRYKKYLRSDWGLDVGNVICATFSLHSKERVFLKLVNISVVELIFVYYIDIELCLICE
jgi:hypothetical protein